MTKKYNTDDSAFNKKLWILENKLSIVNQNKLNLGVVKK